MFAWYGLFLQPHNTLYMDILTLHTTALPSVWKAATHHAGQLESLHAREKYTSLKQR